VATGAVRDNPFLRRLGGRIESRVPWHLLYRGDARECPCCGGSFRAFRPRDDRPEARCPRCNSYERHRVLWMWLRDRGGLAGGAEGGFDLLHVAPEPVLVERLRALPRIRYTGGSLFPTGDQVRVDLTAAPFPDETFDAVLCNHVFDEIPDDRRALAEIHRVLRPGGRLITQTPVDKGRTTTYEDPSLPPARRREVFQTADDVRIYGLDFRERLAAAGFEVELVDYAAELDPATVERHGLVEQGGRVNGTDIYVAVKQPDAGAARRP
jgi:predicted SAM-dependent methyltransferase